jgi:hypothetical protein
LATLAFIIKDKGGEGKERIWREREITKQRILQKKKTRQSDEERDRLKGIVLPFSHSIFP